MSDGPSLDRELDLSDANVPRCPLTVDVPWPIDQRLRKLVDAVNDAKLGPTSKRELVGALIQGATPDPLDLFSRVVDYRNASVGDCAFWLPEHVDPVHFEGRKPGRPGS